MEKFNQIGDGLFIGPQPTEQDLLEAKRSGVRTVIDMRMPGETPTPNAAQVRRIGLNYFNIPVDKAALSEASIKELERVMGAVEGPTILHCATGARAALMLALSRSRENGWDAERTFLEARSFGYDIQESANFRNFVMLVTERRPTTGSETNENR
jgi:uncharacterized protein (TIGR01244 family)